MAKLALLTLHFPGLRLFWCNSAHSTARLFYEMKRSSAEPDAEAAARLGLDMVEPGAESKYALEPEAMLRKMPGVTPGNVMKIMNAVQNLRELASLSCARLQHLCGPQLGVQLFEFLNNSQEKPAAAAAAEPKGKASKTR
jgi:DNA excision repair protein ERCC-4